MAQYKFMVSPMVIPQRYHTHVLSCLYTGRDRQRDCGLTAALQNRNIGIQQERLHGDMLLAADARLLRAQMAF